MRNNSVSSFVICLSSLWHKVRRLQMIAISFFIVNKICFIALTARNMMGILSYLFFILLLTLKKNTGKLHWMKLWEIALNW